MYEELKERCRACSQGCIYPSECSYFLKPPLRCMRQLLSEAAYAIEELSKPRWISVEEGYPAHEYGEGDSVLTVDVLGQMRVLYFNGCWCWPTGECLVTARKFPVTHWMPLPEPPEEDP